MSLIDHLTAKPWVTQGADVDRDDDRENESAWSLPAATVGLRLFLAVVTVLFSLMVIAYAERMTYGDWLLVAKPWLLWLNTAVLVLSSLGLHRAQISAARGEIDGVRAGLLTGGVCALAFLAGQLIASQQLIALGYFASTNPAVAFFYLLTAVHGLHLAGGLVALGRTAAKVWNGGTAEELRLSVELCAFYWHFLLVVWVVLFGLLWFT